MTYRVVYTSRALKQLKKFDRFTAKLLLSWVERNLCHSENPRLKGKSLTGDKAELWRYRVGDYRILCVIKDDVVTIEVVSIGHRSTVYRRS